MYTAQSLIGINTSFLFKGHTGYLTPKLLLYICSSISFRFVPLFLHVALRSRRHLEKKVEVLYSDGLATVLGIR